jgi:hypothetical protein
MVPGNFGGRRKEVVRIERMIFLWSSLAMVAAYITV